MAEGTRYHFTTGEVDSGFVSEIKQLNSLNEEKLFGLIGMIIDFLADPKSSDFLGATKSFCAKYKIKASRMKNLIRSVLVFFQGVLKNGVGRKDLLKDLAALGLKQATAKAILKKWTAGSSKLAIHLLRGTLSVHKLEDIEWKFGVTAANSELEHVGTTFLQLKLVLRHGSERQRVHVELSLPQFYEFLSQMEKLRGTMDYLQAT